MSTSRTHSDVGLPHELLDDDAVRIIRRLQEHGEEAYLVGGCVRDLLRTHPDEELGASPPKDFDVITSATPRQIRRLFRNSRQIGRRFKLVHVFWGQKVIEVITFRAPAEGAHDPRTGDGEMVFGTAETDALLRDFTINALYYDPVGRNLVDFVGGFEDLQSGVLKAIGEPNVRVVEDPVRILRGVRYAAKLGLDLDPGVEEAFGRYVDLVPEINSSRLREEVWKFLKSPGTADAFELLHEIEGFEPLFPGLGRWVEDGTLLADLDEKDVLPAERCTTGLLWAVLFLGLLDDIDGLGSGDLQNELRQLDRAIELLVEGLARHHTIARRDRYIARQLLEAIPRLLRGPRGRARRLARRPYFPEALDLYELYHRVRELPLPHMDEWQRARVEALQQGAIEPEPDFSPRRRRRRRPKANSR